MVETGSVQHNAPLHLAISRCNNSLSLTLAHLTRPIVLRHLATPAVPIPSSFLSQHCSHLHHIWALIIFNISDLVRAIVKLSSICCEAGFVEQPIV